MDNKTGTCFKVGQTIKCLSKPTNFVKRIFIILLCFLGILITFKYYLDVSWKDVFTFQFLEKIFKTDSDGDGEYIPTDIPTGAQCNLTVNPYKENVFDAEGNEMEEGKVEPLPFNCNSCSDYYWEDSKDKCVAYDLDPRSLIPRVTPDDEDQYNTCEFGPDQICTEECPCECEVPATAPTEKCPS